MRRILEARGLERELLTLREGASAPAREAFHDFLGELDRAFGGSGGTLPRPEGEVALRGAMAELDDLRPLRRPEVAAVERRFGDVPLVEGLAAIDRAVMDPEAPTRVAALLLTAPGPNAGQVIELLAQITRLTPVEVRLRLQNLPMPVMEGSRADVQGPAQRLQQAGATVTLRERTVPVDPAVLEANVRRRRVLAATRCVPELATVGAKLDATRLASVARKLRGLLDESAKPETVAEFVRDVHGSL